MTNIKSASYDTEQLISTLFQGQQAWNTLIAKQPEQSLTLAGICFIVPVSFEGYQFPSGGCVFQDVVFGDTADFSQANFLGNTEFNRVRFNQETCFDGARFCGTASFSYITWASQLDFERVIFDRKTSFDASMACQLPSPTENDFSKEDQFFDSQLTESAKELGSDASSIALELYYQDRLLKSFSIRADEKVGVLRLIARGLKIISPQYAYQALTFLHQGQQLVLDDTFADTRLQNGSHVEIQLHQSIDLWREQPIRWRTFAIRSHQLGMYPPNLFELSHDRLLVHCPGHPYLEVISACEPTSEHSPPRYPNNDTATRVNGVYTGLIELQIPSIIELTKTVIWVDIQNNQAFIWLGEHVPSGQMKRNIQPDTEPHFVIGPLNAVYISDIKIGSVKPRHKFQPKLKNQLSGAQNGMSYNDITLDDIRVRERDTISVQDPWSEQTSWPMDCTRYTVEKRVGAFYEEGAVKPVASWWVNSYFSWPIAFGNRYYLTDSTISSADAFYGFMRLMDIRTGLTLKHIPLRTLPLGKSSYLRSTYLEPEYTYGPLKGDSQTFYVIYPLCSKTQAHVLVSFATPLIGKKYRHD